MLGPQDEGEGRGRNHTQSYQKNFRRPTHKLCFVTQGWKVTITVLWFCLEGVWSYFGSHRRQDGVNLSMVHHYSAPLQCIAIVQGCITVVYCWKDCIMQRNRAKLQDDDGTVRTGKSTHSLPTSHQNKCSLDGSLQMRTSDGELESSLKCGETHADSVETAQQDWSN